MERLRTPETFNSNPIESEKDCPRCTQPLGTNFDCNNCIKVSGLSSAEVELEREKRREQDRKFIPGKK